MGLEFETTVVYECRGEANARVYFVATPTTDVDRESLSTLRVSGHVVGPTCLYSSTLQARIPLAHRGVTTWGGRSAITAEAVVPDPCYWSSELPFLYRAVGAIAGAEQGETGFDQVFGMRAIDVVRNKFALNGKIWVPRSVRNSVVVGEAPLALWRETDTTMSVDDPDDELLAEASRTGVNVLASFHAPDRTLLDRIRRLAKFPALMIASIDYLTVAEPDSSEFPNLILADPIGVGEGEYVIPTWRKAAVLDGSGVRNPYNIANGVVRDPIPVIVRRNTGKRSLADARKACDELQTDLAEICDPAGYIV